MKKNTCHDGHSTCPRVARGLSIAGGGLWRNNYFISKESERKTCFHSDHFLEMLDESDR